MGSLKGWVIGVVVVFGLTLWFGGRLDQSDHNQTAPINREVSQAREEFASFAESQISLLRAEPNESPGLQTSAGHAERSGRTGSSGDLYAKFAEEFVALSRIVAREAEAHHRRLSEANIEQLLVPERLYADRQYGMSESREIISAVEALTRRQINRIDEINNEYRARIASMITSAHDRDEFFKIFDEGRLQSERITAKEFDILAEYKKIIDILERDRDWTVSGGQLYFQHPRSLANFNNALSNIETIAEEQARLMTKAAAQIDSAFETFEQLPH